MSTPRPDALPAEVRLAAEQAVAGEPEHDRAVFLTRLARHWPDLLDGLTTAYGDRAPEVAAGAVRTATASWLAREPELRVLDLRRAAEPDWFQAPSMLGYSCYADRFGGDLRGVAERVPYLAELGVTYLHLLPLLTSRPAPDDGGYAVSDYRQVRPDLGTVEDLRALARTLREHGISLTLDLVLNHVAREHAWAVAARAGDARRRACFHVFPDRSLPDSYERTLPEVFPATAPGSFTWDEDLAGWVWTTFNDFQWDLDWSNPEVFAEFADLVGHLANLGVECLRLDAIAFLWKRMGTDCQNQPEVHALTQALRAVLRVCAPATVVKAEAIVGPDQLSAYLGTGRYAGKVSDLAYHNSLMVQVWSSLAARDAHLATHALRRLPVPPPATSWVTYLRCHDDIGWAVDDADAAAVGWDGPSHRRFLSDFYTGAFPGSDARGLVFQADAQTGDRRTSGSAASFAGLEAAGEDPARVDLAVRRLLLAHAVVLSYGGLPVLWSGDELALLNDPAWEQDPAHAGDDRWVHRPRLPWAQAERRWLEGTVEHRVWHGLRHLAQVRAGLPSMHAAAATELLDPVAPGVLSFVRRGLRQTLVVLSNVTEHERWCPRDAVPLGGGLHDALTGAPPEGTHDGLRIAPYRALWLLGS